jgi:glycosyltransferase involved in cell wall biosynthesis
MLSQSRGLPPSGACNERSQVVKPRACIVVASEMTVRAFLARQLAAMQDFFDLTVVVNTTNRDLLAEIGVAGTLAPLPMSRRAAPWSDVKTMWRLIRVMRAGAFDLVHSMTPKAGVIAMIAARIARVPVRIHTFTGQVWATRRGLVRASLKACDRVVAGTATFTLADSLSQRAFLVSEGVVAADRIAVLEQGSVSGVDVKRFRPQPRRRLELRHQLGVPEGAVVLLFVGRLNKDKGVLDLARAFSLLADEGHNVWLLVVGPDEEGIGPRLTAACGRHLSRLTVVDFTSAPEDLMAAADVLCLPSYREGFGTVIIEAAAVGLPAVASRINGVVDAVDDGATGLLHEPGNADALAAQLRRIVRDAAFRRALGEAARKRATRDFCQERVTAALLGFYARLLAERTLQAQPTAGELGDARRSFAPYVGGAE